MDKTLPFPPWKKHELRANDNFRLRIPLRACLPEGYISQKALLLSMINHTFEEFSEPGG
jgi:hypothetical protein